MLIAMKMKWVNTSYISNIGIKYILYLCFINQTVRFPVLHPLPTHPASIQSQEISWKARCLQAAPPTSSLGWEKSSEPGYHPPPPHQPDFGTIVTCARGGSFKVKDPLASVIKCFCILLRVTEYEGARGNSWPPLVKVSSLVPVDHIWESLVESGLFSLTGNGWRL